jgi:hypothetical protein
MVLTQREQKIAIGVGVVVTLLLMQTYMVGPYFATQAKISADTDTVNQQLDDAKRILKKERDLKRVWAEMIAGGLKAEWSEAESQALNAAREWAQDAGVTLTNLKPLVKTQEGKFEVINFNLTCTGSMRQISKLTWALETAPIPVRVNTLLFTPHREGTDDLGLQMNISTLSLLPESDKPDKKSGASRSDTGGRT